MNLKATIRAATSSYLGAISAAVTGLLSIKLATHFLSQEEFGLWSFTMQTVGYFMLMDLGVSSSVSRLFGDPLASGDRQRINSWFTLSLLTLTSQALFILGMGLALRSHVIEWFNIPAHLVERASDLWLAFLAIQAIGLVFKLSFAILHAQNRVYWTNHLLIIGSWAGLGAFFLMLNAGWGTLAYAWSAGVTTLVISLAGIWAVRQGGLHFKLSLVGVTRAEVRRLFTFSSSIFALGLASQVYFASQGLVATKLLGLEAAAIFAVTGRAATIAMQSIWKPFDAFAPRWQVAYCNGDIPRVNREFLVMARFTILLAAAAAAGVVLVNQPFVLWWTKPGYFGGQGLSLLLCVFMIVQGINRCFVSPFILTVRMKAYTWVSISGVGIAILLMIVLTKWLGLAGVPAGLILADFVFPFWFYLTKGSECISVNGFRLLGKDIHVWLPIMAVSCLIAVLFERIGFKSSLLWLITATTCGMLLCIPLFCRAITLLKALKQPAETPSGDVTITPHATI